MCRQMAHSLPSPENVRYDCIRDERRDGGRRAPEGRRSRRPRRSACPASRCRCGTRCRRWGRPGRCGRCCGSTRRTASTARAAPGPTRPRRPQARRVLRERRQGGRLGGDHASGSTPRSSPSTRSASLREQTDHWLEANGRLTEPMYLRRGATHYAPIGWDEALRAGRRPSCGRCPTRTGPSSTPAAGPATRRRSLYQLLARRLGTNNLPDCSNMCHESSGAALTETIGIGKGTVTLEDISTTPS